ncbi:MAG: glycerophosphodiester phosphodiesterase [Burkholderiales bacterium]|nr:glycerophosphodiester phosphodiesterase [Burkholderiales bacterium]MCX7205829.1 glycerophosphodiester phosphodiesterase [Pseudomonadota bacterium]
MLKPSILACSIALALSACGGSDDVTPEAAKPALLTLDGQQPLVVAHRGASGVLPEHTLEAYTKAIEMGADAIEPDLISTKDGVLISRHDPELSGSTDVASRPEFANRKRKDTVDGEAFDGWFASDFTLAEIKTLRAKITTDPTRPQQFNGLYAIPTFQEIIDLAKLKSTSSRSIAVYPETKNPTYHRNLKLALEDKVIDIINKAGWNSKTAPIFVQSFEPSSLKYMKEKGLKTKLIQLVDGDDVDLKTGKVTLAYPYDRPFDWNTSGDKRFFTDMLTPAGLAEIKTYADGIGPWKPYIISVKGQLGADGKVMDVNGDGKVDYSDASSIAPSTLISDAHKAGLMVHAYTFRNEMRRIPADFKNDPKAEYKAFFRLGIDGVFSDFADTAVAARNEYLKEMGR